jgi:hypothetical protein
MRAQGEVGGDVAYRHPLWLHRRQLESVMRAQMNRSRRVFGARRREDQDSAEAGGVSESNKANDEFLFSSRASGA